MRVADVWLRSSGLPTKKSVSLGYGVVVIMNGSAQKELFFEGVRIADTFAEAFPATATRLIVTAVSHRWAGIAAQVFCGNATSVIACDVEAAVERTLDASETPDGRPGVSILAFAFDRKSLEAAVQKRTGQCILTCPSTACFSGLPVTSEGQISIGGSLRYFGDGHQQSKNLGDRRFWRIPVMDGEFVCEDLFGTVKGIAGGNLLICGRTPAAALLAAEQAVAAVAEFSEVILPFPGGIVRSGSKVGSKYPTLRASTNEAWCPGLRGLVDSEVPADCQATYELVFDGLSEQALTVAMKAALQAAVAVRDILLISAGNYGGKLGRFHFHLKDLLPGSCSE